MKLVKILFVATLLWLVVELSELGLLATSTVPLLLKTATHLLLAVGVWALVGERINGSLARIAAAIATAGHLTSAYPPLEIFRSYDPDLLLLQRENGLYLAGAAAVATGFALFGLGLLADSTKRNMGLVLVISPVVAFGATWLGGPLWLVNLANLCACLALFALCNRRLAGETASSRTAHA